VASWENARRTPTFGTAKEMGSSLACCPLDHEVVVIAHLAIRKHLRIKPPERMPCDAKQAFPIHVINKDCFAPITSGRDVTNRTWEFDS
jgi:hypothetical protein